MERNQLTKLVGVLQAGNTSQWNPFQQIKMIDSQAVLELCENKCFD